LSPCSALARQPPSSTLPPDSTLSLSTSDTQPAGPTRGLILTLNYKNMSVAMDRTYYHDPLLYVSHRGNLQQLPNGNQLVGWGEQDRKSTRLNSSHVSMSFAVFCLNQ